MSDEYQIDHGAILYLDHPDWCHRVTSTIATRAEVIDGRVILVPAGREPIPACVVPDIGGCYAGIGTVDESRRQARATLAGRVDAETTWAHDVLVRTLLSREPMRLVDDLRVDPALLAWVLATLPQDTHVRVARYVVPHVELPCVRLAARRAWAVIAPLRVASADRVEQELNALEKAVAAENTP